MNGKMEKTEKSEKILFAYWVLRRNPYGAAFQAAFLMVTNSVRVVAMRWALSSR
jgi:hypothetical protein